jgi:hypothetical protein
MSGCQFFPNLNAILIAALKLRPDPKYSQPERVHRQPQSVGYLNLTFLIQGAILDNQIPFFQREGQQTFFLALQPMLIRCAIPFLRR